MARTQLTGEAVSGDAATDGPTPASTKSAKDGSGTPHNPFWDLLEKRMRSMRQSRLVGIIYSAMEQDRNRCTPQAVCCPGYLCLRERGRARVNALLGSVWYSSIHIVLSLYTIFYDDVLRAFLSKDMDIYFTVVSCFAFLVFTFDLMLQSAVNRKFVYSFFWWLDMAATFSILVDLPIVVEAMDGSNFLLVGGAAQAGTRAGRMLRVMRVVRLLRIVRLVKMWQFRRMRQAKVEELRRLGRQRRNALLRSAVHGGTLREAKCLLSSMRASMRTGASRVRLSGTTVNAMEAYKSTLTTRTRSTMQRLRESPGPSDTSPFARARGMAAASSAGLKRTHTRMQKSKLAQSIRKIREKMHENNEGAPGKVAKSFAARRMSTKIEVKVIAGVICVMVLLPLLDYSAESVSHTRQLELGLLSGITNPDARTELIGKYLASHDNTIFLEVDGVIHHDQRERLDDLRTTEVTQVTTATATLYLDSSATRRAEGLWGFLKTNVIILLLGAQAALLSRDIDNVLIRPMDMITTFLRPVMGWAMDDIDEAKARAIGQRHGQEDVFTRMLLMTLERLVESLNETDRRALVGRRARHKLRMQLRTLSHRLEEEFQDLALVRGASTPARRRASRIAAQRRRSRVAPEYSVRLVGDPDDLGLGSGETKAAPRSRAARPRPWAEDADARESGSQASQDIDDCRSGVPPATTASGASGGRAGPSGDQATALSAADRLLTSAAQGVRPDTGSGVGRGEASASAGDARSAGTVAQPSMTSIEMQARELGITYSTPRLTRHNETV